jgi:hypothetical protein
VRAEPIYVETFATNGTFENGTNSITLGTGPNTLTLTFTGVGTTTLNLVPGVSATPIFGQIQASVTGTGYTFQPLVGTYGVNAYQGRLTINIDTVYGVIPMSAFFVNTIGPNSSTARIFFSQQFFIIPVAYSNYPFGTYAVAYVLPDFVDLAPPSINGGVTQIQGKVGLIPEPTTITLLGIGLAGVAAKVRKRRNKNNDQA